MFISVLELFWSKTDHYTCIITVLEQDRLSCVYNVCINICTRFLCMHNTLVHAQHSCACTGPGNPGARDQARGQGPGLGPKKAAGPVPGPGPLPFWVPGPWVPWPRACTRVLCLHKRSLVYAQEILLCEYKRSHVNTRDSLVYTQEISSVYTGDFLCIIHKRISCDYARCLLCIHKSF